MISSASRSRASTPLKDASERALTGSAAVAREVSRGGLTLISQPSLQAVVGVSDPPATLKVLEKTAPSPPASRLPTARSRSVAPEVELPPGDRRAEG